MFSCECVFENIPKTPEESDGCRLEILCLHIRLTETTKNAVNTKTRFVWSQKKVAKLAG